MSVDPGGPGVCSKRSVVGFWREKPLPGVRPVHTPLEFAMNWMDGLRCRAGSAFEAIGYGPQEAAWRTVAERPGARLRSYSDRNGSVGPVILIIPAPFKRAYVWDLLPHVSVVRHCLHRGARVYLLEWLVPTKHEDGFGLAEYASRLPSWAIDAIAAETGTSAPILAGHSLGGTFAAIFATLFPDRVQGLVLVDAPLAFGRHGGPLAIAVRLAPHARVIRFLAGSPIAGSVINALSTAAAPDIFQGQRHADLVASLSDPGALAIHSRVERWTYDELPLPGQLFEEIFEQLYREDRFLSGCLEIGERQTGVVRLKAPVMAVINPVGRVVPPASILEGLAAAPDCSFAVVEYQYARGPAFQHLGPLVTPFAHARLWPEILDWIEVAA